MAPLIGFRNSSETSSHNFDSRWLGSHYTRRLIFLIGAINEQRPGDGGSLNKAFIYSVKQTVRTKHCSNNQRNGGAKQSRIASEGFPGLE